MSSLEGKTAIVTGGAGGIGLAAAKMFLEEGARVLLVGRTEAKLKAAADDLKAGDALAIHTADVSQEDDTAAFCQAAKDLFGGIDILFANAGIEGAVKPSFDVSVEEFDQVMAINVRGAWLSIKHAAPVMVANEGGSIILTGSVAGQAGVPGVSPYCASKHAINGLTRSIAQELAPAHVRVNAIAPSPVDNDMMRAIESKAAPDAPSAAREGFTASIPMGRYATNDEVAALALFLASDRAAFCTGGIYPVDGGYLSR